MAMQIFRHVDTNIAGSLLPLSSDIETLHSSGNIVKKEATSTCKMFIAVYQSTRCHSPEDMAGHLPYNYLHLHVQMHSEKHP
jgi:hypothetical protein